MIQQDHRVDRSAGRSATAPIRRTACLRATSWRRRSGACRHVAAPVELPSGSPAADRCRAPGGCCRGEAVDAGRAGRLRVGHGAHQLGEGGVGRPGTMAVRSPAGSDDPPVPEAIRRARRQGPVPASSARPRWSASRRRPREVPGLGEHHPHPLVAGRVMSTRRPPVEGGDDLGVVHAPSAEAHARRASRRRSGGVGAASSGDVGRSSALPPPEASPARRPAGGMLLVQRLSKPHVEGGCRQDAHLSWKSARPGPAAASTSISGAVGVLGGATRAVPGQVAGRIPRRVSAMARLAAHAQSPVRCRTSSTAPTAPRIPWRVGSGAGAARGLARQGR